MTLEEQRDYWEERYNIEVKKNKELEIENKILKQQLNSAFDRGFIHKDKFEPLIKEMHKNGSKYWADRIKNIINK